MKHTDHLTTTFLRSSETENKYFKERKKRVDDPKNNPPFSPTENDAIEVFKYWMIIPNDFPYDAIATKHDMLFTRRKVAFDWSLLTDEELQELMELKKGFINDTYDVFYENLPRGQTLPSHFHLHLLTLKRSSGAH